ncbi:MAG: hypothetical protein ACJAZ8_002657 [Planctomycetota bacterium]|jgi:hypothetical protein
MMKRTLTALPLAAAALIATTSCQTSGSLMGPTIAELESTFAVLDLYFNT